VPRIILLHCVLQQASPVACSSRPAEDILQVLALEHPVGPSLKLRFAGPLQPLCGPGRYGAEAPGQSAKQSLSLALLDSSLHSFPQTLFFPFFSPSLDALG
jgi:hypothetical protein